jgi:hypothetical protein
MSEDLTWPDQIARIRQEYEDRLAKGEFVAIQRRADIAEAEASILRTAGVIEVMIRNPNVDSFVKETEARLASLEAEAATLRAKLAEAREALEFYRDGFVKTVNRTKTGLALSVDYKPTGRLLDDCGNKALDTLARIAEDAK